MGCRCGGGARGGGRSRRAIGPIRGSSTTVSNQSTRNNISIQSQVQGEVKINGMTKAQREEERKRRVQNILKQRRTGRQS